MKRSIMVGATLGTLALGVGASSAVLADSSATANNGVLSGDAKLSGDTVIAWNQELLHIVQTPGLQPATVHPTRSYAILHAAIYDALRLCKDL